MSVRLSMIVLPLGAALALLAGCGGDENNGTTTAGVAATQGTGTETVNVSETDFKLDPSNPTVPPGTVSFRVTNDGEVDHNLEVEGPEGEQELEQDIAPGESATLTVDLSTPGTYEFYCPIGGHRDAGMEGEITVSAGDGAGNSGSAGGGSAGDGGGNSGSAAGGSAGDSTGGGYGY